MFFLAFALQAAAAPERFSILVPVANQQCTTPGVTGDGKDIVVCARPLPEQKLPLPNEATSTLSQPVNRDMTGAGALRAEATPCAARIGGCQVGLDIIGAGTAVIRGIQKLVAPTSCCEEPGEATNTGKLLSDVGGGVARAFRHKPDTSRRVAIDISDAEPVGRVLP